MSLLQEYWNKLGNALTNFQFIEEVIKIYLDYSYKIVSENLKEQIPFDFSYEDVKKDSLRILIRKFKKFNLDKELIKKIGQLIDERNFVAHKAYLMTSVEREDDKYLSEQIKRIEEVISKSNECFLELHQEYEKVVKIYESIKTKGVTR